ncbi:MAG: MBL fold metallo-hydrolase [Gammaproteobacteria bacterium]|nr:MBL fold metallo-hydrolase [Gammaproteobacteria bacterium]
MKQRRIGDLQISRIIELSQPFPGLEFFPDTTEEDWAPHREWLSEQGGYILESGEIILPMQSYVVRTTHHTIMIDTCIGNDKHRPHRPAWHMKRDDTYLRNLAAAGLRPEDIDFVMCTHLHHDHVGWNTRLENGRWVPTFPNARYLMSKKELLYFRAHEDPAAAPSMNDSVLPVVESGQAELISSDHALDDEVWLESTPGHTPDHFAVRLASRGEHAVVGGDLMHSPVQCRHPEWRARPDFNPQQASATRRSFMERHCENNTLVCMMHFPLPSAGRFVQDGSAFRFDYDREDW